MNNISIYTVNSAKNATSEKNKVLRDFYYETSNEYCLIYNTTNLLNIYSEDKLHAFAEKYVLAFTKSNIPYFVGIQPKNQVIDYKDISITVGTAFKQKNIIEFITRGCISKIGFFDVRFKDNTSSIDYAIRLGKAGIYPCPKDGKKAAPWFFDLVHTSEYVVPHTFETESSYWLQYKYRDLPWSEEIMHPEDLKVSLKEIKNAKQ